MVVGAWSRVRICSVVNCGVTDPQNQQSQPNPTQTTEVTRLVIYKNNIKNKNNSIYWRFCWFAHF
jgi:hypothetical protein